MLFHHSVQNIGSGFGKGGMMSSHGNKGMDNKLNKLSQDWYKHGIISFLRFCTPVASIRVIPNLKRKYYCSNYCHVVRKPPLKWCMGSWDKW